MVMKSVHIDGMAWEYKVSKAGTVTIHAPDGDKMHVQGSDLLRMSASVWDRDRGKHGVAIKPSDVKHYICNDVLKLAPVDEAVQLYLCEFIYLAESELPSPSNYPVGLRIQIKESIRTRPASISQERANVPGFMAWSTTKRVDTLSLVNWALGCWAKLEPKTHCTRVEMVSS